MSSTKISSAFVIVAVLWVTSWVGANPADLVLRQTAARQQGGAVIFFVDYQGQLRDILFNPIVFNEVVVNQGSAYNNGVFTVPVAGIYQFVFAVQLCRGNHENRWNFMVNGESRMACFAQVSGGDTTRTNCNYMEEMQQGDRVWIKQNVGSCAWASTTSKTITFSGVLLASKGVSTLGEEYGSGSSSPLPSLGGDRKMVSSSVGWHASSSRVIITLLICCLLLD